MSHIHSRLIDQLGGEEALVGKLAAIASDPPKRDAIRKWRANGVPWQWRLALADLAREKRIALPEDFEPPRARRNGKKQAA